MTTLQISVSQFKAKCTRILRDVAKGTQAVKITNHGKIVAVVEPPPQQTKDDVKKFFGCLKGTATYVGDIISPVAEGDWEAAQ